MDCLFCQIAQNKIPSDIVFEDKHVKAFKDIHPKAPVHLLVIPKIHIQSIAHLADDHSDIIARVIYAAKHVAHTMGLSGYKLVFNVGREGGQVVDHLHLHVLGGWGKGQDPDSFRAQSS